MLPFSGSSRSLRGVTSTCFYLNKAPPSLPVAKQPTAARIRCHSRRFPFGRFELRAPSKFRYRAAADPSLFRTCDNLPNSSVLLGFLSMEYFFPHSASLLPGTPVSSIRPQAIQPWRLGHTVIVGAVAAAAAAAIVVVVKRRRRKEKSSHSEDFHSYLEPLLRRDTERRDG